MFSGKRCEFGTIVNVNAFTGVFTDEATDSEKLAIFDGADLH